MQSIKFNPSWGTEGKCKRIKKCWTENLFMVTFTVLSLENFAKLMFLFFPHAVYSFLGAEIVK